MDWPSRCCRAWNRSVNIAGDSETVCVEQPFLQLLEGVVRRLSGRVEFTAHRISHEARTGIARQLHSPSLVRRWRGRSLPASSATLLRPFPGKCRRRTKVCAACKHLYGFPDRPPLYRPAGRGISLPPDPHLFVRYSWPARLRSRGLVFLLSSSTFVSSQHSHSTLANSLTLWSPPLQYIEVFRRRGAPGWVN
ncbi:hypothetical protein T05_10212 [Trichinella murrelli]|uniref:Uncharacterized protein n=1 Tax=Trichinella murrelli TaxID=144512 RepID=A0A0V0TQA2_9BILA|nr:hypothetical protein T05_10212 [Trichinella murrelli]